MIQPVAFSLINAVFGKGVMTVRKGGFLLLLALPLIMKVLEKGVTSAGRWYNKLDHIARSFKFYSIL